jgi:hypothetical protein
MGGQTPHTTDRAPRGCCQVARLRLVSPGQVSAWEFARRLMLSLGSAVLEVILDAVEIRA